MTATLDEALKRLKTLDDKALAGGGPKRVEKQHESGKLTARERLELLFDSGSFTELDRYVVARGTEFGADAMRFPGDGVVTGFGKVDGRLVYAYAQDFTVFGGSLSGAYASKICKVMDQAMKVGAPIVGLNDSGGARIQEGVESLGGYADIFLRNTLASGVLPQLSAILGPCAGGAVYSPAITDFIVMVDGTSHMFVTGPEVIRAVNHEEVNKEELGGSLAHASRSGVCHVRCSDEKGCIATLRAILSYLPSNNRERPPSHKNGDDGTRLTPEIAKLLPENSNQPYDMRELIREVMDDGRLLEIHEEFAPNVVVGFARLDGESVGIVANQPQHLAGCLDIDASDKAARFVRLCDAFNLPLITFEDVPGFLPGTQQEWGGIIRHGAKLLYAFAEATVPKITLITRKAYGGAYCVMSSKHIRADINLAYPAAEIAVMGAEGAVNILFRRELANADDADATRAELRADYEHRFANPYKAAELGFIDRIIHPRDTRRELVTALHALRNKRDENPPKRHGNIPL